MKASDKNGVANQPCGEALAVAWLIYRGLVWVVKATCGVPAGVGGTQELLTSRDNKALATS